MINLPAGTKSPLTFAALLEKGQHMTAALFASEG